MVEGENKKEHVSMGMGMSIIWDLIRLNYRLKLFKCLNTTPCETTDKKIIIIDRSV